MTEPEHAPHPRTTHVTTPNPGTRIGPNWGDGDPVHALRVTIDHDHQGEHTHTSALVGHGEWIAVDLNARQNLWTFDPDFDDFPDRPTRPDRDRA